MSAKECLWVKSIDITNIYKVVNKVTVLNKYITKTLKIIHTLYTLNMCGSKLQQIVNNTDEENRVLSVLFFTSKVDIFPFDLILKAKYSFVIQRCLLPTQLECTNIWNQFVV